MSFNIWNNLDEIALYLGLERLDSETNESFYNRIRRFGRWKYRTDYLTQVHSIPLQLALGTKNLVKIFSNLVSDNDKNYTCDITWDQFTLSNSQESVRVFIGSRDSKLSKILDAIDASQTFSYSISDPALVDLPCRFIVRNSSVKTYEEFITSTKTRLENENIVKGSLIPKNGLVLRNEKIRIDDLGVHGDYFVDYEIGYIEFIQRSFSNGFLKYKYHDPTFHIEITDLNLIPLNFYASYGLTDKFIDNIEYLLNGKVWG